MPNQCRIAKFALLMLCMSPVMVLGTLFRLIYDGGSHGPKFDLPARRGYLFDPSRYAFLEGRQAGEDSIAIPRISDGVLHRVLENLLILDGERLSYRNLDVEQIGSVY